MKSSNFEFLKEVKSDIASMGRIAEQLIAIDPPSAVAKLRLLAETATKFIFEGYQIFKPYQANFNDLLINDEFVQIMPPAITNKLHFIRKKGNDAAHGDPAKISQETAVLTLKQTFDVTKWIYTIFFNKEKADLPDFQSPPLRPDDQLKQEKKKLESKLQQYEEEMKQLLLENEVKEKALEEAQKLLQEKPEAEKQKLRNSGKKIADQLGFDEAETRKRLIDTMLEDAGWQLSDPDQVGVEVKVKHQPTDSGYGYVDYVLWGDEGEPLAIVEAKKTSVSHQKGREQARFYADGFEKEYGKRPVIFYTNGFETSIWEGPSSRRVFGFYSKDSLQYLIFQRENKTNNLEASNPSPDIAGRLYQINAIKKVAKRFQDNFRKALIVQATGTGKTRVSIALCELLLRNKWAKRILFLCDRRELRKQAHDTFKEYLPGEPRIYASRQSRNNQSARIYLATYPGMMGIYENFDVGFFDLIIADESHRSIYNKYRDLFLYFDSLQIGLTATPVKFINRNTYELFSCEDKDPTCFYSLDEAINNIPPYLVPFRVKDLTTTFLREGIKYSNLTPEQRQKLEDEGEDSELLNYEANQIDKSIFNKDTNRIILRNLMENGLKNESGSMVGKSIVFARSQKHADLLQNLFVEMYPQFGEAVCKSIYSD
ncbi:DEAD/DEAH box helicase family protein, partial [bacterium]|nr:DEAD/DEAH box helicase family protein [bacterium]